MSNFIGNTHLHVALTDSTNTHLRRLVQQGAIHEGTLLQADEQSAGRGQQGTHWYSEPQRNLLASVWLKPHALAAQHAFYLNTVVSLSLHDLLCQLGLSRMARIKWPNDLYLGTKKVAGILLETTITQGHIADVIIGVGLNVKQVDFGSLAPRATSLALHLSSPVPEPYQLAQQWCQCLEHRYYALRAGHFEYLHQQYTQYLYSLGEKHLLRCQPEDELLEAHIVGVTSDGLLQITDSNGQARYFNNKQISWHWPQ